MAKKEIITHKLEREYVLPIREKVRPVPRYKKTQKAVKSIKEFIAKHMRIPDRDLNKVKIDTYLNEMLWIRGIRNPIHKIKVRAIKEGDIVRVEAVELTSNLKFKKQREEKLLKGASEISKKKKEEKKGEEKADEEKAKDAENKLEDEEKKKKENEEKKATVVEAGKEMEKQAAKQLRHQSKLSKEPKHQRRMALQK